MEIFHLRGSREKIANSMAAKTINLCKIMYNVMYHFFPVKRTLSGEEIFSFFLSEKA